VPLLYLVEVTYAKNRIEIVPVYYKMFNRYAV
jgi:hypothetical protein